MNLRLAFLTALLFTIFSSSAFCKEENQVSFIKPYCLAAKATGDFTLTVSKVRNLLMNGKFKIIGEYSPYPDAHVFAVTDEALTKIASRTRYGVLGSVMRVGVTKVAGEIQVMYNNPTYIGVAYRMGSSLDSVKSKLSQTIGYLHDFGGEGVEAEELPDYNYAFGLETFGDFYEFAEFKSYKHAVQMVEQGLASDYKGFRKVYRLDIPGKKQTIFGIGMKSDVGDIPFLNDKYFMDIADHKELKRLPHLPYEILVDNKRIIGLHAHYRLAISFPDLPMVGKHAFGKLMSLPWQYEEYITRLVGGEWPPTYED